MAQTDGDSRQDRQRRSFAERNNARGQTLALVQFVVEDQAFNLTEISAVLVLGQFDG